LHEAAGRRVPTLRKSLIVLLFLLIAPITLSTVKYLLGDRSVDWQNADRSSAGLLPAPAEHADAVVRVFAARTVRWRGIFAVHSWIVVKEKGAARYTRYDYTAWGEPIRINGFAADGRWFGGTPDIIAAADGEAADHMIPKIRAAVEGYGWRSYGDYRAWPGRTPTPSSPRCWPRSRNCRPRCRRPRSARIFPTTATCSA
jgi:hypothetical protein